MQLKKFGLLTASIILTGTILSGCSLKEKLPEMMKTTDEMPAVSGAPEAMEPKSTEQVVSPMPSQSTSSEVTDLESDLKMVKFDQESFE